MSNKDLEEQESGVFVGNFHCIASECDNKKDCNSSDALSCYEKEDDEGEIYYDGYCRSCTQFISKKDIHTFNDSTPLKQELADLLGIAETGVVSNRERKVKTKAKALEKHEVKAFIKEVGYNNLSLYRGITDETDRFYGCLTKVNPSGDVLARYYPETEEYKVSGYACRNHPKDFRYGRIGRTGSKSNLYGQIKFKKGGGKYLLVTGGQEDCHAAFQMLRDSQKLRGQEDYEPIAVVSVTTGETSGYKQLAREYDWIDTFENIIIGFDSDEAGEEATKSAIEVLPKDKVKVAKWSGKDPNKMLLDGKSKQFLRDFYGSKEVIRTDIKHSSDSYQAACEFLTAEKIKLPPYLHRLQHNMRGGIKTTGAVINLIGDTSIGKSLFTDSLLYYWFWNSPIVPTIVSLERTEGELAVDFFSMHLKQNLSWFEDGKDALKVVEDPNNKNLIDDLLVDEYGMSRYYVLDERSGDINVLIKTCERAMKQYNSKLIILDPLTDFLRSLGTDKQEEFMMWEKRMKKEGVIFINILHTRKPLPDKDGKVRLVNQFDALGSGTFVQSADANWVINRNPMAVDEVERNTTRIDMPKIRGGTTGHVCDAYYEGNTRTLHDKIDYFCDNDKPKSITTE